jgi:hypothetical protein
MTQKWGQSQLSEDILNSALSPVGGTYAPDLDTNLVHERLRHHCPRSSCHVPSTNSSSMLSTGVREVGLRH